MLNGTTNQSVHESSTTENATTQEAANFIGVSHPNPSYRQRVRKLLQLGSSELVPNSDKDHASILYECFFESAQEEIRMLVRNLRMDVFDQPHVMNALRGAIGRGVRIMIATEEPPQDGNFFQVVSNLPIESGSYVKILNVDYPFNFAVMDGKAMRIEEDAKEAKAIACMNDRRRGRELVSYHQEIAA